MAEVRLTSEGVAKYEKRLEYLKTTARTEIAEQIKVARSFGDLSENAEYDAAKQEQSRIEYEIAEIEGMLRNVVLIDEDNIDTAVATPPNTPAETLDRLSTVVTKSAISTPPPKPAQPEPKVITKTRKRENTKRSRRTFLRQQSVSDQLTI
jgi:hypothetical protein